MTKKLLHKTLRYYLLFSLAVMLLSVPLFYFVSKFLYTHETEEGLLIQKEEFVRNSIPKLEKSDIIIWNKLNRNVKIFRGRESLKEDVFYSKRYYDTLDTEMEPYRILMAPVFIQGEKYTFFARMNLVENEELMMSFVILFTIIIFFLLLGLFIITKRLSVVLWKPFYETLDQIEQFEIDKNGNEPFSHTAIEEFNRLNLALNKLIERNTAIYRSQKEFIENAAHELQTPIAILKGKLEILLQRADVTEGQFELLDTLNNTTTRLNRLNKNLLLLSKIEGKYFDQPEEVVLNDTIASQLDFFKEQALAKKIKITVDLKPAVSVQTNPLLSEVLISNLFLNAINHNIMDGAVDVALDEKSLTFSNTGILKPLVTHTMFERFSKVNPSSKGNGLGLSIIKKITDNNQWTIDYDFDGSRHIFTIHFYNSEFLQN